MRFFESGYGSTPLEQRSYRSTFSAAEARFINLELAISHDAPGRVLSASIRCQYFRNGATAGTPRLSLRLESSATLTVATGGWGARNPGSWQPGAYSVVCDENGSRLGDGGFEVR
jgi:hypothetical protein